MQPNGEILSDVKTVFQQLIPDVPASKIKPETSLVGELHIDSLKIAELSLLLEDHFKKPIFLPDWLMTESSPENLTVGSLVNYLEKSVSHVH